VLYVKNISSKMKDGAILGNAGHFNVEVDVEALEKLAQDTYEARPNIMGYRMPNGKSAVPYCRRQAHEFSCRARGIQLRLWIFLLPHSFSRSNT